MKIIKSAVHVDHIEPVKGADDPNFFNWDCLQSLCHSCHSSKTCKYDGGFGNRKRGE